mmetsp:Transcript_26445/g.90237  ORF Transcript_26445/g.90237 Transcript_26445/m.90237 type:complete len:268 (+) Transcript_26445:368-1171(+)
MRSSTHASRARRSAMRGDTRGGSMRSDSAKTKAGRARRRARARSRSRFAAKRKNSRCAAPCLSTQSPAGMSRVSKRSSTPPPSTRFTRSSTLEKRSTSTSSAKSRSAHQARTGGPGPGPHAFTRSAPNSSSSSATRTVRQASTRRWFDRRMSLYLRSVASPSGPTSWSVRKLSTVCMPLTSEAFRFERNAACSALVASVARSSKGELSRPGSRTQMDPPQGSAATSTALAETSAAVQTRSTTQSTTRARPASVSRSAATASWSFSAQ